MATKEVQAKFPDPGWAHPEMSRSWTQRILSMAIVAMANARPLTWDSAGFRNPEDEYEAAWNVLVWAWWKEDERLDGDRQGMDTAQREIDRYEAALAGFRAAKVASVAARMALKSRKGITRLMPN